MIFCRIRWSFVGFRVDKVTDHVEADVTKILRKTHQGGGHVEHLFS